MIIFFLKNFTLRHLNKLPFPVLFESRSFMCNAFHSQALAEGRKHGLGVAGDRAAKGPPQRDRRRDEERNGRLQTSAAASQVQN